MKLIINFISKIGVDSISRLIGFLTLPVITRYLGPDGYGLFSYIFVIVSYFGFFIDFGYLNYGTNKLCEKIDSRIVIGKIISLQIITAVFSFLVLITAGYFIFNFDKYILLLIFSLTFITQIFAIRYYYLANNKLYLNSLSELAGQMVYAALVFTLFIKFPSVLTLTIFSVIQAVVSSAFLIIPYIKGNKIVINLNLRANIQTLKEAYKLGLSYKAEGITSSFIILCIGIFLTQKSVGLYNASFKIYLILLTVIQAMSYALMPLLITGIKNAGKKNMKKISLIFYAYLLAGVILSLFLFTFSGTIISIIFGSQFTEAIPVLKSLSFTILVWPVVMFLGLIILAFNKYNYLLMISISSLTFSII
ncbi:MAG: oligosaccharide flippase family protein, partial [bacterium]